MPRTTEPGGGRRLLWFVGLWVASVLLFTGVVWLLRTVLGLA